MELEEAKHFLRNYKYDNEVYEAIYIVLQELENSIPKKKIEDLIENKSIDISGFECIAVEDIQKLLEDKNE